MLNLDIAGLNNLAGTTSNIFQILVAGRFLYEIG